MNERLAAITEKIRELEDELEAEIAERRADLQYTLHQGKVRFEAEVKRRHRAVRTGLSRYVFGARPVVMLTAPVIYAIALPLLMLDLFASAYQAICFPVYRIPRVDRKKYLAFDRHHLAYLNALEKFNCEYCSYANGVLAYVREIASRTEQYWCPIKHALRVRGVHPRYRDFVEYGDARAYRAELAELRAAVQKLEKSAKSG